MLSCWEEIYIRGKSVEGITSFSGPTFQDHSDEPGTILNLHGKREAKLFSV